MLGKGDEIDVENYFSLENRVNLEEKTTLTLIRGYAQGVAQAADTMLAGALGENVATETVPRTATTRAKLAVHERHGIVSTGQQYFFFKVHRDGADTEDNTNRSLTHLAEYRFNYFPSRFEHRDSDLGNKTDAVKELEFLTIVCAVVVSLTPQLTAEARLEKVKINAQMGLYEVSSAMAASDSTKKRKLDDITGVEYGKRDNIY
jgi:hypothetical protein